MELREPPMKKDQPGGGRLAWWLALQVVLVALVAVIAFVALRGRGGETTDTTSLREVASKLRAAGALEESARVLDEYLSRTPPEAERYASMAYTLGDTYLDLGEAEKALRWFYAAEGADDGTLGEGIARKIVHCLEQLGRFHAAQAALDSRVRMRSDSVDAENGKAELKRAGDDPVVARLGEDEIHRSEVEGAMDDLPPQAAQSLRTPEARRQFLQQYVAEELLWRKAKKLEYDRKPEVKRQLDRIWRQLATSKFVEDEIVAGIKVDESDLKNYFAANRDSFRSPDAAKDSAPPEFDEVRPMVEARYRQEKMRAAYDELLQSQLSAEGVEVFAERMNDGT